MIKLTLAALSLASLTVIPAFSTSASAGSPIVRWRAIIGTRQPGNVVGAGSTGIPGAGQPFSTQTGRAALNLNTGEVSFGVRGLSFAGGNFIGTTGPFTSLQGVLLFDVDGSASGGDAVRVDLPFAPLTSEGGITYQGFVNLPPVAQTEPDIAFMLVNPGNMYVAHGAIQVR